MNTHDFEKNRHRLDDHERERLWHEIRLAGSRPPAPRSSFGPALAATAVVAAMLVVGSVWLSGDGIAPSDLAGRSRDLDIGVDAPPPLEKRLGVPVDITELNVVSEEEAAADGAARPAGSPPADVERERTAVAATPPPPPARLRGRVLDEQNDPLALASLTLDGTDRGVVADSLGYFDLGPVAPGVELTLFARYLGYTAEDTVLVPKPGEELQVAFRLEPEPLHQLAAITVEGPEYMVEVTTTSTEQKLRGDRFSRYAIDSVEEAVRNESGVVERNGQIFVRGGRSGEVSMRIDDVPASSPTPAPEASRSPQVVKGNESLHEFDETMAFGRSEAEDGGRGGEVRFRIPHPPGSVTGGTTPPNGETYELMYFDHAGVNPFVATEDDRLSTFAVDVDDASFTLAKSYLERGVLPPEDAIRVEEFVNVFDGGWTPQRRETFRIHAEGAPSRFADGYHLLRVGLQGRTVDPADRKPAVLIFVVDVSGSMDKENRLGLVKRTLRDLVDALDADDQIGLVVYGSRGRVVLNPTGLEDRGALLRAIDSLAPGGSTNAHEGLKLAYGMAREYHQPGKIHRVILCSDGVANTGRTAADDILADVRREADRGVHLTTVGFGMGNYNDVLMERLANDGDGHYHYVNDRAEAERVFRRNLTGMLQTIARDVKIQVEFDPDRVLRWRLLGYENRDVADRDFRNDDVDAGEVGADHTVTALYEVKLSEEVRASMGRSRAWGEGAELAVARVRHEAPAHERERAGEVREIDRRLTVADVRRDAAEAPLGHRVQALAAEFAEILRGSYWAGENSPRDLIPQAEFLAAECREGGKRDERLEDLVRMIRSAANLWEERETDR